MKFDKILKRLIEQTLPHWRDKFLCYKILKKQLNVMCPEDGQALPQLNAKELDHFLNLLQLEIAKFNNFFVDKEEEYVIKLKVSNYPHTHFFHVFLPSFIVWINFSISEKIIIT